MKNILIVFATFLFFVVSAQKSNIRVKFNTTNDTVVVLGYYYGKEKYVEDTTNINNKGEAVFSRKHKYNGGMYFIALPQSGNVYFTFLLGNNQDFNIDVDVKDNKITGQKFTNSELNIAFEKFNSEINSFNSGYQKIIKKINQKDISEAKKTELKDSLIVLKNDRKKYILDTYQNQKFSTLKSLVGLIIEPEMPKFNIENSVKNKDSLLQMKEYYYYKNHYWDYVDLKDSIIIRTPFFIPKFEKYISNTIIQNPDTVAYQSIKLIEKSKGNITVFAFMINYMLTYNEKVKLMGMDKVFVEIGKKYYVSGEAVWSDSAYTAKVIEKVFRTEPNLIGEKAPAIIGAESIDGKAINMYDIDAKYLVIIFWEPSCGHCKTELPELYSAYNELIKKGIDIEVFAMLGDKDTAKWKEFIKEKEITNWINVWDKHWQTNFKIFYDVYSTPTIYVLDDKKKIIAKRITSEQVKEFILKKENKL